MLWEHIAISKCRQTGQVREFNIYITGTYCSGGFRSVQVHKSYRLQDSRTVVFVNLHHHGVSWLSVIYCLHVIVIEIHVQVARIISILNMKGWLSRTVVNSQAGLMLLDATLKSKVSSHHRQVASKFKVSKSQLKLWLMSLSVHVVCCDCTLH